MNTPLKTIFLRTLFIAAGSGMLWLSSCQPDDPNLPTDPKNTGKDTVTTFNLKLTKLSDNSVSFASCFDPDGAGPKSPTLINSVNLKANSEYDLEISAFDDTDPLNSHNFTDSILKYKTDYLLCVTSGTGISLLATDTDGTRPIGLKQRLKTFSAASGTMVLNLKYQKGVKNGDCSPGTSMLNISFPLVISN